jgi:hypothetical protein
MNEEFVIDIWSLLKAYLDKKQVELAAEKFVDTIIDYGMDDTQLQEILGVDKDLDNAITYYLEMDEIDPDEEDWDE